MKEHYRSFRTVHWQFFFDNLLPGNLQNPEIWYPPQRLLDSIIRLILKILWNFMHNVILGGGSHPRPKKKKKTLLRDDRVTTASHVHFDPRQKVEQYFYNQGRTGQGCWLALASQKFWRDALGAPKTQIKFQKGQSRRRKRKEKREGRAILE